MNITEVEEFLTEFLPLRRSCQLLGGISRQRLYDHVGEGLVAFIQTPHGRLYRASDIEAVRLRLEQARIDKASRPMRACTRCGETKLLSQFSFRHTKGSARSSHCKACKSKHTQAYRARRKEQEGA